MGGVVVVGKLQSHGGERSHRGAEGTAERFPHRGSVPTSTHQPERLVCSPAGAGRLGAEAQASEVRSHREDWGWLREHSLKGASAPQLAEGGVWEKVWTCLRGKRRLFRGVRGEGIQSTA